MRKWSLAAVMLTLSLLPFSSQLSLAASMPTVPTGLAAVAGNNYLVSLSWNASTSSATGAIKYRVVRDDVAIGSQQKACTDADHPSAGTHAYQVRAIDAQDHKSTLSAPVTVVAVAQLVVPGDAPANLAGSTSADGGASLSWDPVAGASAYGVLRGSLLAGRTSSTSFTDYPTGHLATTYAYSVEAINAGGAVGPASAPVYVAVEPSLYPWAGIKVTHGSRDVMQVALTFDDCYGQANMNAIVSILNAKHVTATFNCIGQAMKPYPAFFADLSATFPLGNHTWDHKNLSNLTDAQVIDEMTRTTDLIEQISGWVMPAIMRPPGGYANASVLADLKSLGLIDVTWDIDSGNWQNARPGAVILLHPLDKIVAKLPAIIDSLRAKGYTLVTVPQMFGIPWQPAP